MANYNSPQNPNLPPNQPPGYQQPNYPYNPNSPGFGNQPRQHPAPAASHPTANSDYATMAMLAHLAGPAAAFFSAGIFAVMGPLIIWLIYREKDPAIAGQAAEAFNFQITMSVLSIVMVLLSFTVVLLPVTIPGLIIVGLLSIVLGIVAALKANKGEYYQYPIKMNLIS